MAENAQCTTPVPGHRGPGTTHASARQPQVLLVALAAMALAACAPSTEPSTAPVPTLRPVISMSTAPSTPAIPIAQQVTASGPFLSPSGNILCNMATYSTGGITTRCEVTNHDWVATQPANCQQNWGDRVGMEQGSAAVFGCYGQKCPPPRTPSSTARFRRSARSVATARRSESCASTTRLGTTSSYRVRRFSSAEPSQQPQVVVAEQCRRRDMTLARAVAASTAAAS
jgi:hypothetical protein